MFKFGGIHGLINSRERVWQHRHIMVGYAGSFAYNVEVTRWLSYFEVILIDVRGERRVMNMRLEYGILRADIQFSEAPVRMLLCFEVFAGLGGRHVDRSV